MQVDRSIDYASDCMTMSSSLSIDSRDRDAQLKDESLFATLSVSSFTHINIESDVLMEYVALLRDVYYIPIEYQIRKSLKGEGMHGRPEG